MHYVFFFAAENENHGFKSFGPYRIFDELEATLLQDFSSLVIDCFGARCPIQQVIIRFLNAYIFLKSDFLAMTEPMFEKSRTPTNMLVIKIGAVRVNQY